MSWGVQTRKLLAPMYWAETFSSWANKRKASLVDCLVSASSLGGEPSTEFLKWSICMAAEKVSIIIVVEISLSPGVF